MRIGTVQRQSVLYSAYRYFTAPIDTLQCLLVLYSAYRYFTAPIGALKRYYVAQGLTGKCDRQSSKRHRKWRDNSGEGLRDRPPVPAALRHRRPNTVRSQVFPA